MNSIKLPIKSIDIDNFIKIFKKEIDTFYKNINKQKDFYENQKSLKKEAEKEYNKLNKKQNNDLNILFSIINERNLFDLIIEKENELYIDYLKKNGYKISTKDDYKIVKKNIVKKIAKYDYHRFSHNLVQKNGKKYFEKTRKYNNYDRFGKNKILRLSTSEILNILEGDKVFNKYSFVPKLVDTVIIYKNKNVDGIKYIYEYVDGKPLVSYLKGLNDKKKEETKKKVIKIFKEIKENKNKFLNLYLLHKDVVVTKSGKVYLTGIRYYSNSLNNSIDDIVNRAFDYDPQKNIFNNSEQVIDITHVLLLNLIDNGCIKFK
jgi:hypothetical protein